MKKFIVLLAAVLIAGCGSVADSPPAEKPKFGEPTSLKEKKRKPGFTQLELDTGAVKWTARGIGKRHTGTVPIKSAYLDVAAELAEAEFVLDMKGLEADMKGLTTHLKGEDFFNVSEHPTAQLFVNKVVPKQQGVYQLTGYLTIKGEKRGLSFPAVVFQNEEGKLVTHAKFSIDRTLWGIRYGSGKFYEDLGDKLIKDLVDFEVDVVFKNSFEDQEIPEAVPKET